MLTTVGGGVGNSARAEEAGTGHSHRPKTISDYDGVVVETMMMVQRCTEPPPTKEAHHLLSFSSISNGTTTTVNTTTVWCERRRLLLLLLLLLHDFYVEDMRAFKRQRSKNTFRVPK